MPVVIRNFLHVFTKRGELGREQTAPPPGNDKDKWVELICLALRRDLGVLRYECAAGAGVDQSFLICVDLVPEFEHQRLLSCRTDRFRDLHVDSSVILEPLFLTVRRYLEVAVLNLETGILAFSTEFTIK